MFIKIYTVLLLSFMIIMLVASNISRYLEKKPKTHRFRKFWSDNIIDLDNRFD